MQIDCTNLGDTINLSDHVTTTHEPVRVLNLHDGQAFIVDISLNGDYTQPDGDAKWIGAAGREGVHTALLTFVRGNGFTVRFDAGVEVANSRGRGVVFAECNDFAAHDVWVRGARTAGISLHDCAGFTLHRPTTIDTGNYQDRKGEGPNWPGSIKFESCHDYQVLNPITIDHTGNGITATQSSNGTWLNSICIDTADVGHYINASPDHTIRNGLHVGASNAFAINSEEEFNGTSDNPVIDGCYALTERNGVGFWGNEGKPGIVIEQASVTNCLLIAGEQGIKIHPNANIKALNTDGTLTFDRATVDSSLIYRLSQRMKALKLAIIAHQSNDIIDQRAQALRELFETLRPITPIYKQGQVLYIMATVADVAKASERIKAGAVVGGLELRIVADADPWQRAEELSNTIQAIGMIIEEVTQNKSA